MLFWTIQFIGTRSESQVSLATEVTLSYFADAQTERLKMLTRLHIDWEGDFISISVTL